MKLHQIIAGIVLSTFAGVTGALAQSYTFVPYADTNGPLNTFLAPTLNNNGTIAFKANIDAGGQGVFAYTPTSNATIATTAGIYNSFSNVISMNDTGTVAFRATRHAGGEGLYTGSGGAVSTILDSSGGYASFGVPSINPSGTLAFLATGDTGGQGIQTYSGGTTTDVALFNPSGTFGGFGTAPAINAAGTVAFLAFPNSGGTGIYTGNGGATTLIAHTSGALNTLNDPAINADGTVAFVAGRDAGGFGVYTGTGVATTEIANTDGLYQSFGRTPSINTDGDIAFFAFLDNLEMGIYTGNDPVADKVIEFGDPLFGSMVVDLAFERGMNDNGDVAFRYQLANGVRGVAVAVVPEPAGLTVLAAAGALLTLRRRRNVQ